MKGCLAPHTLIQGLRDKTPFHMRDISRERSRAKGEGVRGWLGEDFFMKYALPRRVHVKGLM